MHVCEQSFRWLQTSRFSTLKVRQAMMVCCRLCCIAFLRVLRAVSAGKFPAMLHAGLLMLVLLFFAQVEAVPTRRLNVMRSAAASPVTTDAAGIAVVRKPLRVPDSPR